MRIEKLQVMNFQGLRGSREYSFTDTVYAVCEKNGSGKTSLLNALRYAFTGIKSDNMITIGAESSAVKLNFSDGTSAIRQEFINRNAKYYIDNHAVSKKTIDEELANRTGVSGGVMNIVTSSEVLSAMKPQDFADFLLSYIPEQLTTELLISYLPEISESAKDIVKKFFPKDGFDTEKVGEFYDSVFRQRRDVKRRVNELAGVLKQVGEMAKPEKTAEEYNRMQAELQKEHAEVIGKIKLKASYDKRKAYAEASLKQIKELGEQIQALHCPESVPERNTLMEKITKERDDLAKANTVLGTLRQNISMLQKSLDTLDQPVCPLSKKITCTTDKTKVRRELEESLSSSMNAVKTQEELLTKQSEVVKTLEESLQEIDRIISLFVQRKKLEQQIEKLKKDIPELGPDPGVVEDADRLIGEMRKLIDLEQYAHIYEIYVNNCNEYKMQYAVLKDLEYLVSAFSPKGVVKQKITEYYLSVFEDDCNSRAAELKSGFRVRFFTDNGVVVYADMNGEGVFRPFPALSGGEQIYVLFLLLDMLNRLTGVRILVFDELSMLDRDAYASFIRLIRKNAEDYDLVLLSSAEHDDLLDVNRAEGIPSLCP